MCVFLPLSLYGILIIFVVVVIERTNKSPTGFTANKVANVEVRDLTNLLPHDLILLNLPNIVKINNAMALLSIFVRFTFNRSDRSDFCLLINTFLFFFD